MGIDLESFLPCAAAILLVICFMRQYIERHRVFKEHFGIRAPRRRRSKEWEIAQRHIDATLARKAFLVFSVNQKKANIILLQQVLWYMGASTEVFYDNECRLPDWNVLWQKRVDEFSDAYILARKLGFSVKEGVREYVPYEEECGVPFEN